MLVVMAEMLNTSAGALFAAATMPGFLLAGPLPRLHHQRGDAEAGMGAKRLRHGPYTRTEFWRTIWRGLSR